MNAAQRFAYHLGRMVQWLFGRGGWTHDQLNDQAIALFRQHQRALDDAWNAGYAEGYQDGSGDRGLEVDVAWEDETEAVTVRGRQLTAVPDQKLN